MLLRFASLIGFLSIAVAVGQDATPREILIVKHMQAAVYPEGLSDVHASVIAYARLIEDGSVRSVKIDHLDLTGPLLRKQDPHAFAEAVSTAARQWTFEHTNWLPRWVEIDFSFQRAAVTATYKPAPAGAKLP